MIRGGAGPRKGGVLCVHMRGIWGLRDIRSTCLAVSSLTAPLYLYFIVIE